MENVRRKMSASKKAAKKKNVKGRDENEMAFDVISHTIQSSESKPPVDPAVSAAAKALSKLGASKGGKARAASLTNKRRSEIAKKAAVSRWRIKTNPQKKLNRQ